MLVTSSGSLRTHSRNRFVRSLQPAAKVSSNALKQRPDEENSMNLRLTLMFLAGLSSLLMTNAALSARSSTTLSPSSSLMSTPTSAESVMDVFELPCTKTYVDGRTRGVASCGGESAQEVCCDIDSYKDDASSCVLSCSCTYSEHREGTREVVEAEYPVLIRGVPILSQFDARSRSGYQPIGCGPIAVTQLALYARFGTAPPAGEVAGEAADEATSTKTDS